MNYFLNNLSVLLNCSFILCLLSCSESISSEVENPALNVSLRMEVIVLDSLTHTQPKRRTLAHLFTYVESKVEQKRNLEYSDTTTCSNGWAVKELLLIIKENEKIVLGITTLSPKDVNYKFRMITYDELILRKDDFNNVRFIKTFHIYE
ncbi:MAG: hypothetical protein KKA84_10060 [Bacteroidetes bacterium]|nr:hypothetical protein [Bacteroidota bacterium]